MRISRPLFRIAVYAVRPVAGLLIMTGKVCTELYLHWEKIGVPESLRVWSMNSMALYVKVWHREAFMIKVSDQLNLIKQSKTRV